MMGGCEVPTQRRRNDWHENESCSAPLLPSTMRTSSPPSSRAEASPTKGRAASRHAHPVVVGCCEHVKREPRHFGQSTEMCPARSRFSEAQAMTYATDALGST